MIDAARVRRLTERALSEKAQTQIEDVEKAILDAVKKGQFLCAIKGEMMPQTIACLTEMGYSIKNNTACNECWTTISWGES